MTLPASKFLVAALLVSSAGTTSVAWPAQPSTGGEELSVEAREFLERAGESIAADVREDDLGSIALAVVLGDSVVWERAWGMADPVNGIAATPRTLYRIGSVSKSITALTLARLVDQDEIELDDLVVDCLEEFGELDDPEGHADQVTLRQLASHTSGLIREPGLENAAQGPIESWRQKIQASLPTTSFQTAPGQAYAYSNIGYGILGLALERAMRTPFQELVEAQVFRPAGMTSSCFVVQGELAKRLAVGSANRGDEVNREMPAREHKGRGYKVPNGGVYSTVGDLGRLIAVLTRGGGEYLGELTWSEVTSVQTPENPDSGYGLGLFVEVDKAGRGMLSHGGAVWGYTAHWAFDPDRRVGAAVLRNYNEGRTNLSQVQRIVRQVAQWQE